MNEPRYQVDSGQASTAPIPGPATGDRFHFKLIGLGALLLRLVITLLAVASFNATANTGGMGSPPRGGPRTAVATVDAFVDAIARGDGAAAHALLMPGVLIFESGEAEMSADEYARHHLPADIKFMAGMNIEQLSRGSGGDQSTSWVATRLRMRGHHRGKAVDLESTETVVLTLTGEGWRIAHIHWSSSPYRAEPATPAR